MQETIDTAFFRSSDRRDPKPDLNVKVAYHRTEGNWLNPVAGSGVLRPFK